MSGRLEARRGYGKLRAALLRGAARRADEWTDCEGTLSERGGIWQTM